MQLNKRKFNIETDGLPIRGRALFRDTDKMLRPLLIFHGFKSFANWGFYPYICRRTAEAGAAAVIFDFSHNGIKDEEAGIFDVDVFARNTIARQMEEARLMISKIADGTLFDGVDKIIDGGRITLFGHSLGGGLALLLAGETSAVDQIVTWAPVSTFYRYTKRQEKLWLEKGHIEFENAKTGQMLRLGREFLSDIIENETKYKIPETVSTHRKKLLIINGMQDMTVPLFEGERIAGAAGENGRIVKIKNTGHTFGIEHPMKKPSKAVEQAVEKSLDFIFE